MKHLDTLKTILHSLKHMDQATLISKSQELLEYLRTPEGMVAENDPVRAHMWPTTTNYGVRTWLSSIALHAVRLKDETVRATLVNGPGDDDDVYLIRVKDKAFIAFAKNEEEALDLYAACEAASKLTFASLVDSREAQPGWINFGGEWHDMTGYTIQKVVLTNINMKFAETPDADL